MRCQCSNATSRVRRSIACVPRTTAIERSSGLTEATSSPSSRTRAAAPPIDTAMVPLTMLYRCGRVPPEQYLQLANGLNRPAAVLH